MWPFQRVAMDLITGLLLVKGKDAILTIVDQGCSHAAIFLLCSTTIMGPEIVQLYHNHIFRWFRLLTKIISNRDPRFTSHFGRALTARLEVKQNLSMAFHPQMDRLSEQKNWWIEQYLRLMSSMACLRTGYTGWCWHQPSTTIKGTQQWAYHPIRYCSDMTSP
jgi:hypothetical protein